MPYLFTNGRPLFPLGEHLQVDRRSVYRMINLIEELGFPVYDEKPPLEKEKRWRLEESYLTKLPNMKVPDVNLTVSEIVSLYFLKGEASLFKGTEIEKHARSALEKLSLFVPESKKESGRRHRRSRTKKTALSYLQ